MLKNIPMYIMVMKALVADDIADLISYIINCPDRVNIADVTIFSKAPIFEHGYS